MIELTRLNETVLFINPHQIEFIEETPDTIITMFSGKKVIVRENPDDITKKIIVYRKRIGFLGNDTIF